MEEQEDKFTKKCPKRLQMFFNTRRQLFKANSVVNVFDIRNEYDDEECKHLLENSAEVNILSFSFKRIFSFNYESRRSLSYRSCNKYQLFFF